MALIATVMVTYYLHLVYAVIINWRWVTFCTITNCPYAQPVEYANVRAVYVEVPKTYQDGM